MKYPFGHVAVSFRHLSIPLSFALATDTLHELQPPKPTLLPGPVQPPMQLSWHGWQTPLASGNL